MLEEYRYHIVGIASICIIAIILIFSFNEEEVEIAKPNVTIEEKVINIQEKIIEKPKVVEKKEIVKKEEEKTIVDIQEEFIVEENKIDLFTSNINGKNNKYFVKILADQNITSERNFVKYITIKGNIEKDSKAYPFKLSLDSEYSNNWNINLNLEIVSFNKEENYECDGSFLKSLDNNSLYEAIIYLSGKSANCYITYQEPLNIPEINTEIVKFENAPKDFLELLKRNRELINKGN